MIRTYAQLLRDRRRRWIAHLLKGYPEFNPQQPRDESGRWSPGPGILTTQPERLRDLFERLVNGAGGFTVHAQTGEEPTGEGHYAVSIFKGRETAIPLAQLSLSAMQKFLRGNRTLLRAAGNYFGAWVDEGQVYFDVSRVVSSAAEAERLAREYQQLAYFDFGTLKSVYIRDKILRRTGGPDHDRPTLAQSARRRRGAVPGAARDVPQTDRPRADAGGQERDAGRPGPAAASRVKYSPDQPRAAQFMKTAAAIVTKASDDPPHVTRALRDAVALARRLVEELRGYAEDLAADRIEAAIRTGNLQRILAAIEWADIERVLTRLVRPELEAAFALNAKETLQQELPEAAPPYRPGEVGVRIDFRHIDAEAVRYAERTSAKLVTEITQDQEDKIRAVVARAERGELTYASAAKELRRDIGLHSRQVKAVNHYRERLQTDGRSAAQIERLTARYAKRLLVYRTETIARHELLTATHNGKLQAVRLAMANGELDARYTVRRWITALDERVCLICAPMHRVEVPADQPWTVTIPGTQTKSDTDLDVWIPQEAHIQCRCSWALVTYTQPHGQDRTP